MELCSTGAIPKDFVLSDYTLVDDNSDKTTSISYKLKVKHLCQSCQTDIDFALVNRFIKPLHHALECERCNCRCVRQPYASLCSICSLIKRKCVMCMEDYNEFEGSDHPADAVLSPTMRSVLSCLPYEIKRGPIRKMFQLWKLYIKGFMDIVNVRDTIMQDLLFWYSFYY